MSEHLEHTIEILRQLVGFETISGRPTHDIVGFIETYLNSHGVECSLSFDEAGERANVFATIGPEVDDGVVFCGHTDVVPVDGQVWTSSPFELTRKDGKLFGRGSVDMKGFLACVMASVPVWQTQQLKRPVHVAFSYDEETGGHGMPVLLKDLAGKTYRPSVVIVGEPTDMKLITGHKGGFEMRTEVHGLETHSSMPSAGVNAISYAVRLIDWIDRKGRQFAAKPDPDSPFNPPYLTLNVGIIHGGAAANATAGQCAFDWEFRPLPGQDGHAVLDELRAFADKELLPEMRQTHRQAAIDIIVRADVPPLDNRNAALAAAFVRELTGQNSEDVVSFGTDAGYFSDKGFSTVVFGPGSITRAHKPDEFILESELADCLAFLSKAGERLCRED
jgi:acetylornithine deacetylase